MKTKFEEKYSKVEIDIFDYLAREYIDRLLTPEDKKEIEKKEFTKELFKSLEDRIKKGTLVNVQILGKTASGKSTVAIKLAQFLNKKCYNQEMEMGQICADQIEFSRKMKNPKSGNEVIVIDEFNWLGDTGANATVEAKMLNQFSDVHAQRFIHKIGCSPTTVIDGNADIILTVTGTQKETLRTFVTIEARIITESGMTRQLIGHAKIYVGDTLESELYERYRKRKFKKMELLTKHSIRDVRELESGILIKKVYDQLKGQVTAIKVNNAVVANYIEATRLEQGLIFSLVAEEIAKDKATGLLQQEKSFQELEIEILRERLKLSRKTNPITEQLLAKKITVLAEMRDNMKRITNNYLNFQKVYKEYMEI